MSMCKVGCCVTTLIFAEMERHRNDGLWNVVICLFVCFDVHGPAREPATANKTSSLKTFVWFDLSRRPHGHYPEDRGPSIARTPAQGIADINGRVFYITGFTMSCVFAYWTGNYYLKWMHHVYMCHSR